MGGNGNGTYNALGWLTQRIDVVSDTEFYRYSRDGELRRSTNRRSQTIEYIYDVLHRPTSKSGTNTATETYAYPSDTVLVATSPVAVDTLLSNRNGQLLRVGTVMGTRYYLRRYSYTAAGALDSVIPSGDSVALHARHYVWDMQLGSLVNIGLGSAATSIQHDRDAMLSGIVFPGGDAVSRTSNSVHTTADLTTTAPYSATVNRSAGIDAANRIQRQITSTTAGHQYTYDGLGRLRSDSNVVSSGGTPCDPHNPPSDSGDPCTWGPAWLVQGGVSFSYDSAGNRRDLGGSYAWGNRIRAFDGCSYATDSLGDGNVTRRICGTDTVTFTWTAENRLASLTSAGQTTTFDYNAAGQLVRMSKPGHVRQFLWERDNLLAELDSAGTLIAEYSYYPGMDNPHAMLVGNTKYFAHSDIAGNVTALTDSAQNLARWYESTAWGTFSNGGDIAGLAGKDRSRFKGALWFGDALGDLYYMRDRWYEPRSGRFLSEDPIGSNPGVNPYAFAGNDPVDLRDPSGDDLTPVTLPDGSTVWMDCYTFGDATKCYAVDVGGDTVWGEGGGSGDDGSGHKDDGPGVERGPGAGVGVRPRQRAKNACYENNKFSSLFGGGKASQIVSWAETGSAISLGSDIVAMTLKATRTGAGGSVNPYASGFNMAGRAIVRTGGRALKLSNSAIGRGVGYVNAVGDKVSPVLAIIGAFTLAYNTTIDIQCRLGILQ